VRILTAKKNYTAKKLLKIAKESSKNFLEKRKRQVEETLNKLK
jgi:hypothetical protein